MNQKIINNTICHPEALENLKTLLLERKDLEGIICEIGVYKGGSLYLLCENSFGFDVLGIDTFEGLPESCEFDNEHCKGNFSDTTYEHVENLISEFPNCRIFKLCFPDDSFKLLNNMKFKFVHLDVDLYTSLKNCLEYFIPKMVKDGIIVSDDYSHFNCLGAKKAMEETANEYDLEIHNGKGFQGYFLF